MSGRAPRDLAEQVEGRRAVRELLLARRRSVHEIWLATDAAAAPILDEIVGLAEAQRVRVRRVPGDQVDRRARTEAPQGVIASAAPLPTADFDELVAAPGAFVVALDGLTDPQNVGAVLRTAETMGATGAALPAQRAAGLSPAVTKAAAGAIEYLPIAFVPGIPAALERAKRAGVWSVALDAGGSVTVYDLTIADQPLVLVLGAEGRGVSRLARQRCDVVASIAMHGHIESLNVSAAAAIACSAIARRREG